MTILNCQFQIRKELKVWSETTLALRQCRQHIPYIPICAFVDRLYLYIGLLRTALTWKDDCNRSLGYCAALHVQQR